MAGPAGALRERGASPRPNPTKAECVVSTQKLAWERGQQPQDLEDRGWWTEGPENTTGGPECLVSTWEYH